MLRVADGFFSKSDRGRQRRANEDKEFARPPLFAVADGMGGARAGEIASKIVVEVLGAGLPEGGSAEERLAERVREANRRINEMAASNPGQAGMGTTLTAAYVGEDAVSVAHVGDSRAYRLRDGELEQITNDHSLVSELVRRGKLTEEEAEEHPQRSVITRALGPEPTVDVDTWTFPAQPGDLFLLCSDGLTSMVDEARIAELVRDGGDLAAVGQALIDEANRRGGRDNITVVLFALEEVGEDAEVEQPTEVGMRAPSAEQLAAAQAQPQQALADVPAAEAVETAPRRREPPKRTAPLPAREPEARSAPRRRRRIRGLRPALVALLIVGMVGTGGWIASRAVYFVGTDRDGFVTIYRGLPYEGPLGLPLYERVYVSAVPASEIPAARRGAILDHELRTHQDARDLVRQLELGRVET